MTIDFALLALLIMLIAFCCEAIDSSIGMGYGTLLAPILILMGFNPTKVVPAILLTQAIGGGTASIFHHRYGNVNYRLKTDRMAVFVICSLGVIGAMFGACVSVSVSKMFLNTYIGVMVLCMGILVTAGIATTFAWWKILLLGIVSAFNKGLSGGGFGPIVTGGQVLSGNGFKSSIGITTMAEVPICLAGFIIFSIHSGFALDYLLNGSLFVGVVLSAFWGPKITKHMSVGKLRNSIGIAMLLLGGFTLYKTLM